MEAALEFIKRNTRTIVAGLVVIGIIITVSLAGDTNQQSDTDEAAQDTSSESTKKSEETEKVGETARESNEKPAQPTDNERVGSEPEAGPVAVGQGEDGTYSATARAGDNQTVIVRQFVNEYAKKTESKLSSPQRLYMETVLVNELGRDNTIPMGENISIDGIIIETVATDAEALSAAEVALWATYL